MINVLPKNELKMLLEQDCAGCLCVSIYMPTHRGAGRETRQDHIRLKNLLRAAEEKLIENGLRRPDALKTLQPATELLDDSFFWRDQSDGLALFAAAEFFKYYRLPLVCEEFLTVGYRFHIKPLIKILGNEGRFYVLALSQAKVRLLECTRQGVKELPLVDIVPASLDEFLKFDQLDRQYQYHYHSGVPSGQEPMIAHGRTIEETNKTNILRYFQQIDRGLRREIFANETAPLAIAGVEYVLAIYREANTYHNLLSEELRGNPEGLNLEELRDRAWPIVEGYFERSREDARRRYSQLSGMGRTSVELAQIVTAAYQGTVDYLFVDDKAERWGGFDPEANSIELHQKPEPCDDDLIDLAVVNTLAKRGIVYPMRPGDAFDSSPVAAVFRYSP